MYSVRLLLRSFAREVPHWDHRFAHSWKPNEQVSKDKRKVDLNRSDQLAGIRRHTKAMGYTADEMNEYDGMDDDEIDMSMAEQIYDAHMGEMRWKQSKHTLAEYGQKYYKPKPEPALLSWEDMEQIRHLHIKEKWPYDVLAKSFPANELIINKVCDSTWKPSIQEQFKHNKKVAQNWILLREGKLEISDALRNHCLQFTNRVTRPMTSKEIAAINMKPQRPPGSFLSILRLPDQENNKNENQGNHKEYENHSEPLLHDLRRKMTLQQARQQELEHIADRGIGVDDDMRSFVCGPGVTKDITSEETEKEERTIRNINVEQSVATKGKSMEFVTKWDSSGTSTKAARQAMMAPSDDYPDHITIPETSKKPGAIYRVEDCFYDENGEFMYRVPGLKL